MSICISHNWLSQWFNLELSPEHVEEQLTAGGLEVDGVKQILQLDDLIVGGYVQSAEPHPNADKLSLCQVDVGHGNIVEIICGCSTVRAGIYVVVATPGAILPGGLKIKPTKLRGVLSHGMICSASELGLVDESSGIMILGNEINKGEPISSQIGLPEMIYQVDITPNRGDCLSVFGMARELSTLLAISIKDASTEKQFSREDLGQAQQMLKHDQQVIHRGALISYHLLELDLEIESMPQTPCWMKLRLLMAGYRPISLAVDLTNYILHELGQPMHAFDAQKLTGKVYVRYAKSGEKIVLLDDREYELDEQMLVIADDTGAIALAGVMGGKATAVSETTRKIALECAQFKPECIAYTGQKLHLSSDSSERFERGVDADGQEKALVCFVRYLSEILEFKIGHYDCLRIAGAEKLIDLRLARIKRILGIEVTPKEVETILARANCTYMSQGQDCWQVTPPSYRNDLNEEIELIEEIIRIQGYDTLVPSQLNKALTDVDMSQVACQGAIAKKLVSCGFTEVISYSFIAKSWLELMGRGIQYIEIKNPISPNLSIMRSTLIYSMCEIAQYNIKRQRRSGKLFEYGKRFLCDVKGQYDQEISVVSGIVFGMEGERNHWQNSEKENDFYYLKGVVESILCDQYEVSSIAFEGSSNHPLLHPNKAAKVVMKNDCRGWLGQLHPRMVKLFKLPKNTYVFEVDMNDQLRNNRKNYTAFSKFPSSRKDISFYACNTVSYSDILDVVWQCNVLHLVDVRLFDLYQDEEHKSKKSYSLALTFQSDDHTLTDEVIMAGVENIANGLDEKLNIELRGTL